MALYHFHAGVVTRSAGSSVVASAAYRAGEKLHSAYYGEDADYTRKAGVIYTEIFLPPNTPDEYKNRETLWNAVEKAEKHPRAQLAYTYDFALQNELTMDENIALARRFVEEQFVSKGIGHLVQNKTGHISYKNHKQVPKPREEWIKVENTHEPLIEKELWDFVQATEDRLTRGRSGKNGMVSLFAGVLRCMDCGGAMRFSTDYRKRKNGKPSEYKAYLCNRYMSGGRQACSPHYINQRLPAAAVAGDRVIQATKRHGSLCVNTGSRQENTI